MFSHIISAEMIGYIKFHMRLEVQKALDNYSSRYANSIIKCSIVHIRFIWFYDICRVH